MFPETRNRRVVKAKARVLATRSVILTLLGLTLGLMGTPAQATGCDCGTLSSLFNQMAEKIVNGIVLPLDRSVREAASYETINLHRDLLALREAVLRSGDDVSRTVRTADQNQADRTTERTYEAGSQPESNCGNNQMGGELQLSRNIREKTALAVMDRFIERKIRYDRPLDYLGEMLSGDWPGPREARNLGAVGVQTLSLGEMKNGERLLEGLSNPLPVPEIPEGEQGSPAGRTYQVIKNNFETRQALFQSFLAAHLAERAPTVAGLAEWAGGKWTDMGGEGQPPGVVEGYMSQKSLFWYLANQRLSSANWHEKVLPKLPEAGLLRELAAMQAVQLELLRRQNEHLENITLILTLTGLDQQERERQTVRAQYGRVTGTGENEEKNEQVRQLLLAYGLRPGGA